MTHGGRCRHGYTIVECVVAIAVLGFAALLVVEVGVHSLVERTRAEEHFAAMEAVANELEAARAIPWATLTPEWAAARKPSADVISRLVDASLTVRVEPEKERPRVKRMTAELRWKPNIGSTQQTVSMTGLFADRTAGGGS
ncbi:MAG: type II secretion system protein [Gemmataceae bacterium]